MEPPVHHIPYTLIDGLWLVGLGALLLYIPTVVIVEVVLIWLFCLMAVWVVEIKTFALERRLAWQLEMTRRRWYA